MIDIKAIRAAAEAATPGPWIAAGPSFGEPLPKYINCVVVENEDGDADDVCIAPIGCDAISTNDLTYIATANPSTVIALCDEIERLTTCLKRSNEQAEHFEREWYLRGDEIERLRKDAARLGFLLNYVTTSIDDVTLLDTELMTASENGVDALIICIDAAMEASK